MIGDINDNIVHSEGRLYLDSKVNKDLFGILCCRTKVNHKNKKTPLDISKEGFELNAYLVGITYRCSLCRCSNDRLHQENHRRFSSAKSGRNTDQTLT